MSSNNKSNNSNPEKGYSSSNEVEKLMDDIPEENRDKVIRILQLTQNEHQGPLPSFEELQGYEQLLPGITERLLSLHENVVKTNIELSIRESNHDRQMEVRLVDIEEKNQVVKRKANLRGQIIGGSLALICIGGAIVMGFIGAMALSLTLGGGTVIGLSTIYALGRKSQEPEDPNVLPPHNTSRGDEELHE
jgi:uncharacterized membrane protein